MPTTNYQQFIRCCIDHTHGLQQLAERLDITDANRAFRWCCKVGSLQTIELLLSIFGTSIRADANSCEAFRWACQYGHTKIVTYLHHTFGSSIDANTFNNYALRLSCQNGHTDIVQYLIDNFGSSIDVTAMSCSSLIKSCTNNRPRVTKLLIDTYADVFRTHVPTFLNTNSFAKVCEYGWFKIAEVLVEAFKDAVQGPMFKKALGDAAGRGWFGLVKVLIDSSRIPEVQYGMIDIVLRRNYGLLQTIADDYADCISSERINEIFRFCVYSRRNPFSGCTKDHVSMQNLIISKFKDKITPKVYGKALVWACTFRNKALLTELLADLDVRAQMIPEVCDKVLLEVCRDLVSKKDPNELVGDIVFALKDLLTVEACNSVFGLACDKACRALVNLCCEHLGAKIDINARDGELFYLCLRHRYVSVQTISQVFGDRILIAYVRKATQDFKLDYSVKGSLVDHFWDRIHESRSVTN